MENFLNEKQFIASALITTKTSPRKILLVHHKKAQVWLPPGGHIEHTENPIEAVIREVREETGLDISPYFTPGDQTKEAQVLPLPKYMLEEKIEEHGSHLFHYHIDLLYHIEMDREVPVTKLDEEAYAIGWFSKEEVFRLPLFDNTKKMLEELLQ